MGTVLKITATVLFLAFAVAVMVLVLIPLLPWRVKRIRLTNRFGTIIGRSVMWISRCPLTVEGRENARAERPAIYIGNHTSMLDAFTSIWLCPVGTAGVAKKEILYYPFYGQIWALSGHLSIDRGNLETAKRSLKRLGELVRRARLHIWMWPEGTRSRDGRLLPFKKGVVHLALQTGLPIVPVVTEGAHRAIEKSSLKVRRVPIRIRFLPPIDTTQWSSEHIDQHLEQLRQVFVNALPPDQRPLPA